MPLPPLLETDPRDWALDRNNNLIIPIRYLRGLPAILQAARVKLSLAKGEWFLNIDLGQPYLETEDGTVSRSEAILGDGQFDPAKATRSMRFSLESIRGVRQVTDIRSSFAGDTRTVSVVWSADTQFGVIVDDAVLVAI